MEEAENQEGNIKKKPSCPLCFKKELDVQNIIPNNQMRKIIGWFQRQRAYRAKIYQIDLGKKQKETENNGDDDRSRSSSEDFNEQNL